MSDQAAPNPASSPNTTPGDVVQLSKQEYAQMVSANSQLKAQLDLLVQHIERQEPSKPQANANPNMPAGDVDSMSNTQLVAFIQQQMATPILNTVMQLAVKEELREVKAEFSDFDDYKDQVYQLASTNTSLTLKQAYQLAKSGKPAPPAVETKKEDDGKSKAAGAKPDDAGGQKPNATITPGSATPAGVMSTREAAAAALKELQYSS